MTPSEAAKLLGLTPQRVRVLIRSGRLPATTKQARDTAGQVYGHEYEIKPRDVSQFRRRGPGRPSPNTGPLNKGATGNKERNDVKGKDSNKGTPRKGPKQEANARRAVRPRG